MRRESVLRRMSSKVCKQRDIKEHHKEIIKDYTFDAFNTFDTFYTLDTLDTFDTFGTFDSFDNFNTFDS